MLAMHRLFHVCETEKLSLMFDAKEILVMVLRVSNLPQKYEDVSKT